MPNTGTINVIRENKFKGAIIPFNVFIDGQYVGELTNGQQLSFPVYLGHHVVTFKTEKEVIQEVDITEQSLNVYINVNCKMGLLMGRPNIINVYYG